jgi:hypothetical protein
MIIEPNSACGEFLEKLDHSRIHHAIARHGDSPAQILTILAIADTPRCEISWRA